MNCPKCKQDTKVTDTRKKSEYLLRRRECLHCKERFVTREYSVEYLKRLKKEYLILQQEVKKLKVTQQIKSLESIKF